MAKPKMFPMLRSNHRTEPRLRQLGCLTEVRWVVVEAHEEQARDNHDQTLKRLAERGGLSPCELALLLTDTPLFPSIDTITIEDAVIAIANAVAESEQWKEIAPGLHRIEVARGCCQVRAGPSEDSSWDWYAETSRNASYDEFAQGAATTEGEAKERGLAVLRFLQERKS